MKPGPTVNLIQDWGEFWLSSPTQASPAKQAVLDSYTAQSVKELTADEKHNLKL